MKLLTQLRESGRGQDMQALVQQIPYARFLGISVDTKGNELTTVMPFGHQIVGNTTLPAIHGGVLGGLLEITSVIQLLHDHSCERLPKTIDIAVDYLRSGRAVESYGRAFVTRSGRRVANVRAEVWQEQRSKPVAVAHGHFLLTPL